MALTQVQAEGNLEEIGTFDRLRRLTDDVRNLPAGDPHLLPGKLAGLVDLRLQHQHHASRKHLSCQPM